MKIELTKSDLKQVESDLRVNGVMRYLKHMDSLQFNIGDILIKQEIKRDSLSGKDVWSNIKISHASDVNRKFVYVFENELGVGYVKQLKADGSGFSETGMMCMANVDHDHTRYVIDPDYADHLLLSDGEEGFDYAEAHRVQALKREQIAVHNKSILENTKNGEAVVTLLGKLKVGDTIWLGRYPGEMVHRGESQIMAFIPDKLGGGIEVKNSHRVQWDNRWTIDGLVKCFVSLQKPLTLKDIP